MANSLGTRLARIDVLIGGADQAQKQVDKMRDEWKKLRKEVENAQEQMNATTNTTLYDDNKKIYNEKVKQLERLTKLIRENQRNVNTVNKYLNDISGQTLRNLGEARKGLNQMLLGINPKNAETLQTVREYIKQIADEIQRRKGNIVEFSDIIGDIGNVSDKSLGMAKQRLQELISTTQKNTKEIQTYREQLKKVEDEEQRRISANAGRVMGNLGGSSLSEIQEAIKVTTQLRDAQKRGSQEWEIYNDEIQKAQKYLQDFNDKAKQLTMFRQMGDLTKVSSSSLSELKKYWQEQINGADTTSAKLKHYQIQLQAVMKEEERRISVQAGKVMGNLTDSSVSEIQEAIKVTMQLRDAQKLGSQEWDIYNDEIQKAQKYLSDFNDLTKQLSMSDRMRDLGKASESSLAELKKYWQEQVNGAQRGSQELAEYESKLKQVLDEEKKRSAKSAVSVFSNLSGSSLTEIQDAIKATTQLRDATELGSKQWDIYNQYIERAKKYLSDFENTSKNAAIAERMKNIGNASTSSLAELKKFWQEQVDGAELSSQKLQQYQQSLEAVVNEEQKRVSQRAQTTLGQVQTGTFDGTISQTKEAIKLLEQYKQQLKTSDTKGIKDVESAINSLNEKLKQSSAQFSTMDEALLKAEDVGMGTFDGTYEDLEKLKKSLEEYKKSLEVSDTKGLKKIQVALDVIDKKQKEASEGAFDFEKTIENIKSAPLKDLQRAAAQLQEELMVAETNSIKYIQTSEKLRDVNKKINEIKRGWEEHDNQIVATIKRLTSYVLVYAGFNEVVGRIKQLYQANLQLSDSLADIEKTTGLSTESVAELSREIDSIDTRTAQQELHDLAYEAGKLGISAKEDVLGFVKAGNQLLVALGEDLGGAEAVRQLMKVNAILGETQKLGVEKALLATGSAINEISQTSRASAGPIVDVVNRIGAIGEAAGLSMSDLIALAGTLDALGQHAEMGGTALNTFISTLTSNTTEVAQAVGLSDEYLKNLIEQGKTIQAVIAVFEKMNAMGGLDVLAPIMKDLGSDGERIKQVLVTLSSGVDELKAQVFTSSRAFKEATSVTDEYNIKNENAMAIMQRMGNAIKESFINSGFVEWITDVLRWMYNLPAVFERNRNSLLALKIVISEILVLLAVAKWKAIKTMLVDLGKFLATPFTVIWKSLKMEIASATVSLEMAGNSTAGLTGKLRVLGKVIASNPWGLIATGVAAAVSVLSDMNREVNNAAKISLEFTNTLEKEREELFNLKFAIDGANQETGEKAALIKELNDKYGAYLGFMVTEQNYQEKSAFLYDLINEKLRESIALKMQDKLQEKTMEKYVDLVQDLRERLQGQLINIDNIGETNISDAMAMLLNNVRKAVRNEIPENGILGDLFDKYDIKQLGSSFYTTLDEYIDLMKKMESEMGVVRKDMENTAQEASKSANKILLTDLRKSNKDILSSSDLTKLKTYLQEATTYVQRIRSEVDNLNKKREEGEKLTASEEADLKEKNRQLGVYTYNIEQVEKRIKAIGLESVWGQGVSLETAGVDKLVATYKKLEAMMKSINEDKDYADTFAARGFKSAKEEYEALKKMEQDVAKVLAEKWGRDTSGNWLKVRKSGTRGEQKELNDQVSAAMAALEAYFLRRQQAIRQAYLNEEITTEEMNRQIEANEFEHLNARIKLRRSFLGDMESLSKEEMKTYGLDGKDLEKLSKYLLDKGQAMQDGIRLKLVEDELKMREDLLKHQEAIRKILLDNDYTGQVDKEFMSAIDKLELLFGKQEEMTEESGIRRMNILRSMSQEAYLIDVEEFRKRIEAQSEFSEWRKDKTTEDYQALLYMLQKYNDDYEAAENRAIERRKKIAEKKWEKSGQKEDWQKRTDESQANVDLMQTASGLGLASDSMVEDAKLEYYKLRIEASKAYLEQMEQEMQMEVDKAYQEKLLADAKLEEVEGTDLEADYRDRSLEANAAYEAAKRAQMQMTLDARQKLNEAMNDLDNQEMEIQERKLNTLKEYTDAIVDFSGQMGEAAFGEVEDRKQAAQQLIQTTMNLTKQLIMQKIQELLTKKALKKQEVAIEQSGNQSIVQSAGSTIISGLAASEKGMGGKITGAIAGGSAKIIDELGWWGIPLIAVISAALNGLMSLAMGAFSKSKSEVAAVTGASASTKGRVATGMLTYAEGDYPVLGNDGQIYNARYQKELKTGVYGGGAHFGIFSEKKPEMIVDGDTTQKLILNYPHIYDSILTIARHGQLKSAAMPTFASGSYPSIPAQASQAAQQAGGPGMSAAEMSQVLTGVTDAVNALTQRLNQPISATVDPYGRKGAVNQLSKASKFMNKNGLTK